MLTSSAAARRSGVSAAASNRFLIHCWVIVEAPCLRWNIAEPLLLAAYGVLLLVWFAITAKRAWGVALFRAARFWSRAPSRSLDQEKVDDKVDCQGGS